MVDQHAIWSGCGSLPVSSCLCVLEPLPPFLCFFLLLTSTGLDICITLPAARRRGAASMSLQWGVDKADEMDVEAFIEATVEGAQLYERFGFRTVEVVDLKRDGKEVEGDEEWKSLEREYPLKYRWMEREKKSARS